MNSCKRQNAFSDIPGFDASKGERIVKALQKLWEKIEYLENICISERKSRSEEIETNSKVEDLTITDVQYKLLLLQLQYVRSILRKRVDGNFAPFHSKSEESDQNVDALSKHYRKNKKGRDFEEKTVSEGIESEKKLTKASSPKSDILQDVVRIDAQVSTDDQLFKYEDYSDRLESTTHKGPQSSKPHYHLKLDDVPFILGASSTASHSVVANVQNVIAMMKSHNKALCGPKQVSKSVAHASPSTKDTEDTTKMLYDLSQGLCELSLKQQKLAKRIDAAEGKKQASNKFKNFLTNEKKHVADSYARRHRSNSESKVQLHADVNSSATWKGNDFVKYNLQQKKNILNVRNHPTNLSIMDRRKMLRSLQNFKTYLSQEDISWN